MEVQQRQELEMAEVTSKVYDILHPTPVSLKQLSAITISLEIWRRKVNEYRASRKLEEFDTCSLRKETTWMKTMLPDLPSTIYKTIEEVVSRFGYSLEIWQDQHYDKGFWILYTDESYVLEDFDDFVCDYDGSIHYARTAERMMHCEGFNSKMKFIVACMYFFEDDIKQIWPSVSNDANLELVIHYVDECLQVYYWICHLSNKLEKIPTRGSETVDERMFWACMCYNRPSVEYFWNRIPVENQMQILVGYMHHYNFVRFILPRLDDEQLDKFFNDLWNGGDLYVMFLNLCRDERVVLRTWCHIRNIVKESNFTELIVSMFETEDNGTYDDHDTEKWEYLCCQIWNHTPPTLKPSVIRVISSDNSWFTDFNLINVELLLTILQDASSEERNLFLRNCWSGLIERVRSKHLQRVIELCFENDEDEITQFKQNVIVKSGEALQYCVALLEHSRFEELNAFVSFCCAELQTARNLKQQILRSAFLDEYCELSPDNIRRMEDLNEFVNDAFDNADLFAEFKNRLISSSSFMDRVRFLICYENVSSKTIIKFITTLFSTEETVMQVKKSLIDSFKGRFMDLARMPLDLDHLFSDPEVNSILLWCLGSNEGVEEFKLNCTSQ